MLAKTKERTIIGLYRHAGSTFESPGLFFVERVCDYLSIEYIATEFAVDDRDATYVKLNWCEARRELWISHLRIASGFRRRGLGTWLVAMSERLAWHLNARSIHVFPLHPAREFWLAVGYRPHATISRVLTKTAHNQSCGGQRYGSRISHT